MTDDHNHADPDNNGYTRGTHDGRIAWIWTIFVVFAVPEVGTLIRAGRIVFFRNIRRCNWAELLLVMIGELGHVLGLGMLTFLVFPELDAIKAVMLTNAMSLVPAVLSKKCIKFDVRVVDGTNYELLFSRSSQPSTRPRP